MKIYARIPYIVLSIILSGVIYAQNLSPEESNDQNEFTDAPEDGTPKISDQSLPWEPPNYKDQHKALGWRADAFVPPVPMQARVDFWVDIYTKYSTSQGVLHDAYFVDIVYDPIDFREIRKDQSKTPRMQKKAIEKIIKEKRSAIQERLLRLSKLTSGENLAGEDLRYWNMFSKLKDKDRFIDAADQRRIRFQLGQSDRFLQGIFYSGRYLKQMEAIFREEALPIELTRLPFVESSFNIFARSKVGASGVWQFMRRTAKLYMKVNASVDERNDPLRAARSAARMLRQNYQYLGNWPLAITGWNHGPNGVKKIVKKLGTDDLSKIVSVYSSNRFGFASENFYASFLAALHVEANANKYFTNLRWSRELENIEIKLTRALPFANLKSFFDSDLDRTLLLNPQFQTPVRRGYTPIPAGSYVHIPKSRGEVMRKFQNENLSIGDLTKQLGELAKTSPLDGGAANSTIVATVPTRSATPLPAVVVPSTPAVVAAQTTPTPSEVPATAEKPVANPAQTSTPPLITSTNLEDAFSPSAPSSEKKMNFSNAIDAATNSVPTSGSLLTQITPHEAPVVEVKDIVPTEYKVRRGDNFNRIAKRLKFKVSKLLEANPEMAEAKLMPGMKIKLPPK